MSLAQTIKDTLDARTVADRYGLAVSRGEYICCPFHAEKTPSCKVYSTPGRGFHCFGCGAGGSVIDLAMKLFDLPFRQTVVRLASDFGLAAAPGRPPVLSGYLAERRRKEAEHRALGEEFARLNGILVTDRPTAPGEPFTDAWCDAAHRIDYVEYLLKELEAEGYGRRSA